MRWLQVVTSTPVLTSVGPSGTCAGAFNKAIWARFAGSEAEADSLRSDGKPSKFEVSEKNKSQSKKTSQSKEASCTLETAVTKLSSAVDNGETLSSDSDEATPGDNGEDVQSPNLVLAQFEKVTRAKSKWKCTLKEGVMTLNSKDVLFGRACGEFLW
eukprot:CAMPEP_0197574858 /NCGR_PEP_ID=MMETSP1326-20131121/449_1 /TAXON_ID=1155430 /ORGANISM="Genus nov. species nov., Strain RCC2288" /LENGTH=156 /DNA_ID=CAMNT_0043137515 /DNA_START=337 /DNA_END=808 /DNA_ORIENTATION=+